MTDCFKIPLTIIRLHSKHLLAAHDRLSDRQMLTLLKAIRLQAIMLEHLLNKFPFPHP